MIAGLATAEELAKGASIAHEGLAVPPPRNPAPSVLASRPSPANVMGPGKLLMLFVVLMSCFVLACDHFAFLFAQVLLILRSQVGPTHCARFILWSEVRFWPPLLMIFL